MLKFAFLQFVFFSISVINFIALIGTSLLFRRLTMRMNFLSGVLKVLSFFYPRKIRYHEQSSEWFEFFIFSKLFQSFFERH